MLPTLKCLLVGTTLLCCLISTAQDSSSINELASLSPAYYSQVSRKLEGINTKIDQSTEKYLKRITRQEKDCIKNYGSGILCRQNKFLAILLSIIPN
jgi:hypothetical protein